MQFFYSTNNVEKTNRRAHKCLSERSINNVIIHNFDYIRFYWPPYTNHLSQ